MKLSSKRLKEIIEKEFENLKEEKKINPKEELESILKKWESSEYDSDEARWEAYAKDIQNLINKI